MVPLVHTLNVEGPDGPFVGISGDDLGLLHGRGCVVLDGQCCDAAGGPSCIEKSADQEHKGKKGKGHNLRELIKSDRTQGAMQQQQKLCRGHGGHSIGAQHR